jgi:hypothetical protein
MDAVSSAAGNISVSDPITINDFVTRDMLEAFQRTTHSLAQQQRFSRAERSGASLL